MRGYGIALTVISVALGAAAADDFSAVITKVSSDGKTVFIINSTKDRFTNKGGAAKEPDVAKEKDKAKEPDKTKEPDKGKEPEKGKELEKGKEPQKGKEKPKAVKETALEVAGNVRITKAAFNKDTKRLEHGKPLESGLSNKMFEKIERGIPARFKTVDDKVTEIIILTAKKKGES